MGHKAALIGAGGVAGMGLLGVHDDEDIGTETARASHAGGYSAVDEIDIVAAADIDREQLRRFGESWDVPPAARYEEHETMLEREEVDIVSVCTPTMYHHEHVIDAATSSADPDVIWCEKPIASCVRDAERMIEICDDTDTELLINHSLRFTEKLQTLRDRLNDQDLLGEIFSVHAQFRMELMRNATHLIDTLVFLLDARADLAMGYITGENEAVDTLEVDRAIDDAGGGGVIITDDGTFTTIDCTVPREVSSMCYIFVGENGKLYLNNDDGEWRFWELRDGEHVEKPLPGISGSWTWETDYRNAFANAAAHAVDLAEGRAENLSSGRQAIKSLEIIVGLYATHYLGGRLEFPLPRPLKGIKITSW